MWENKIHLSTLQEDITVSLEVITRSSRSQTQFLCHSPPHTIELINPLSSARINIVKTLNHLHKHSDHLLQVPFLPGS